jgi:uncharacterized protein YndB with AHSA1/START domain
MATKNKPNELYITRIYDAPVKMVWEAWADPEQAAKWWGPRGFTITNHSKDLRSGGHWAYTMHGPDGVDYENTTQYLEVEKYSRMVYDHGGHKDRPPLFRVMVEFKEISKNKTQMEMTMIWDTAQAAAEAKKFIKQANGNSTWDRLGEYLEKETSGKEKFIINRTFDCSIETMFEMWSNPKHFSQWLPPTGFNMTFIRSDIKVGGTTFYFMSGGDVKMYGSTHYKEITRPNKIVYSQDFRDENEKISRHPFAPTWPESMLTTVDLTSEGDNKTRVTITWEPVASATPAELDTFIKERAGMTQGWTGSFDKLEAYLTNH